VNAFLFVLLHTRTPSWCLNDPNPNLSYLLFFATTCHPLQQAILNLRYANSPPMQLTFGGQSPLNVGIALGRMEVLGWLVVPVLGIPVRTLDGIYPGTYRSMNGWKKLEYEVACVGADICIIIALSSRTVMTFKVQNTIICCGNFDLLGTQCNTDRRLGRCRPLADPAR
jgi:hypothetical protein